MLKRSATLSRYVTTERLKEMAGLFGLVVDQQFLLTAKPNETVDAYTSCNEKKPSIRFPEVWRDLGASIQLFSTPEARSLTGL